MTPLHSEILKLLGIAVLPYDASELMQKKNFESQAIMFGSWQFIEIRVFVLPFECRVTLSPKLLRFY